MTGIFLAAGAGGAAPKPSLPASLTAEKIVVDPTDATATIAFLANGTIEINGVASGYAWTDKPGIASGADFRVKFDRTGGTADLTSYPSGASDNVYTADISVTRTFTLTRTTVGTTTSTGTFTVEKISTGETDTATGSFTATVES